MKILRGLDLLQPLMEKLILIKLLLVRINQIIFFFSPRIKSLKDPNVSSPSSSQPTTGNLQVDVHLSDNRTAHYTSSYHDQNQFIIRRGFPFKITVTTLGLF